MVRQDLKLLACPSGSSRLFFSLAGLFGLSLSRISPRLLRARRRLLHQRCAVMFTSQTPCQSSGRYCVVPLNLLAPPWMLWRAFWPPLSQRCFCRFPCWILPRTLWSSPDHGTCHSDFGTGIPFFCGLYKAAGAEAHQAPLSAWQHYNNWMAGLMAAPERCRLRRRLCSVGCLWPFARPFAGLLCPAFLRLLRVRLIAPLACCQNGACKATYGPTQRASLQHAGRKAAAPCLRSFSGRGCAGAPSE